MANWNDDLPNSSRRAKKPANTAATQGKPSESPVVPDGNRPSWNDGASTVRSGTVHAGGGLWQSISGNRISQGLVLFLMSLGFVGGLAYFIVQLLAREDMVPVISIVVNGYEQHPPFAAPNALAESDQRRLGEINTTYLSHWRPPDSEPVSSWDELKLQLDEGLRKAAHDPSGPSLGLGRGNQRNLILFLSMHLATREQHPSGDREAVLLMPKDLSTESTRYQDAAWHPLTDLLSQISSWRTEKSSDESPVHVLVLLDCGKQRVNPYLAVSTAGLTSAIRRAFENTGDDLLFGLVSQDDGQQNWTAPELSGSLFGYAVSEALRGAAAERNVTLVQFRDVVTAAVSQWARDHRGAEQTPVFIQRGRNDLTFPLLTGDGSQGNRPGAAVTASTASSPVSSPFAPDTLGVLNGLWDRHQALVKSRAWSTAPAEFSDFEQKLVYAEQALLAGVSTVSLPSEPSSVRLPSPLVGSSLAMLPIVDTRSILSSAEMEREQKRVEDAFLQFLHTNGARGQTDHSAKAPVTNASDDAIQSPAVSEPAPASPPEIEPAQAVEQTAATEKPPEPLNVLALRNWLTQRLSSRLTPESPVFEMLQFSDTHWNVGIETPVVVESQFVRMLWQNVPWSAGRKDPDVRFAMIRAVSTAVLCRFALEDLTSMAFPTPGGDLSVLPARHLFAVREEVEKLDADRRDAEDLLFSGQLALLEQSHRTLNSIIDKLVVIRQELLQRAATTQEGEDYLTRFPALLMLAGSLSQNESGNPEFRSTLANLGSEVRLSGDDRIYRPVSSSGLNRSTEQVTGNLVSLTRTSGNQEKSTRGFQAAWQILQSSVVTGTERNLARSYVVEFLQQQRESSGYQWPGYQTLTGSSESAGREPADRADERFSPGNPADDSRTTVTEPGTSLSEDTEWMFSVLRRHLMNHWRSITGADLNLSQSHSEAPPVSGETRTGSSEAQKLRDTYRAMIDSVAGLRAEIVTGSELREMRSEFRDVCMQRLIRTELALRLGCRFCPGLSGSVGATSRDATSGSGIIVLRTRLEERHRSLWQAKRLLDDLWGTDSVHSDSSVGISRNMAWFVAADTGSGRQGPGIVRRLLEEASEMLSMHPAAAKSGSADMRQLGDVSLDTLHQQRSLLASGDFIALSVDDPIIVLMDDATLLTSRPPTTNIQITPRVDRQSGTGFESLSGSIVVFESADEFNDTLQGPVGSDSPDIRFPDRTPGGSDRMTLPLNSLQAEPVAAKGVTIPVRLPRDFPRDAVRYRTWYRGHVSQTAVRVNRSAERIAVLNSSRPVFSAPQIALQGHPRNLRPKVMFILDCSGSMIHDDVVSSEGNLRLQRGVVCRAALIKTLRSLSDQNFDVGLTLLGHRSYWKIDEDSGRESMEVSEFGKSKGLNPGDVNPDEDVQVYMKLGELTSARLNEINGLMEALARSGHPYGSMTPLYLAMETSLREFAQIPDQQSPRFLVVLTDGVNQVYRPDNQRSITNVSRFIETQLDPKSDQEFSRLRCHLVYLAPNPDVARDESERERLTREKRVFDEFRPQFTRVFADRNRGSLSLATDSSAVETELLSSLDWIEFQIHAGQQRSDRKYKLDSVVTLPIIPRDAEQPKKAEITVSSRDNRTIGTSAMTLEGGENLTFVFRHQDRTIEIPPYEFPAVDQRTSFGYLLKAHRPLVGEKGSVTLPISLQRIQNSKVVFTERPSAWHAEVRMTGTGQPLPFALTDGTATAELTRFALYDRVFQDGKPIPVIPLEFPWSARGAFTAEVHLWVSFSQTAAGDWLWKGNVRDALELFSAERSGNNDAWPGPGSLTVRRIRDSATGETEIRVRIEGVSPENYFATRVDLVPPPDRSERRFYIEPDTAVVHRFYFSDSNPPDIAGLQLRLMDTEKFRSLAQHLTEAGPLVVPWNPQQ